MRELAAIKMEAMENEREIYDLAHASSLVSVKTKKKEVPATI